MTTTISAELQRAYESTVYCVHIDGRDVQFRVNEVCAPLDKLLAAQDVQCAAFITAANPRSKILTDAENAQRNAHLATELANAGFHYLMGEGRDPTGVWQPEHSLLVFNIERTAAIMLARQYGQLACVYIEVGKPAELLVV